MPRVKDLQRYRKIYSYYRPKPVEEITTTFDEVIIQGLDWKQSVIAASTGSITASLPTETSPYFWPGGSGSFTLDDVTLEHEDRILLKDQTTASQNGIYLYYTNAVSGTYWFKRSLDAEQDTLTAAAAVFVEEGSANADCAFVLTTNDPITIGSSSLTWAKFAGPGSSIFLSSGTYGKTTYNVSFDSGNNYPNAFGSDVFFYVSGTIGTSTGSVDRKAAVFGGDVVISGSLGQGSSVKSYGTGSHAQGFISTAYGDYSHAEGNNTITSGDYSHAEGISSTASGASSHAEGASTIASGYGSHAEGGITTASGIGSHSEGRTTSAQGSYSHSEGLNTLAIGNYSHAAGVATKTEGDYSYAGGANTVASGAYQHVVGQYNAEGNTSSLFIVGNGDGLTRTDILRVNSTDVQVTGSLWVSLGVSGSLTQLTDGTSYLIAGTGIGITSASNGGVTISAVGAGVPGGPATSIQYNDGGAFTGSLDFTYNGSSVNLTGSFLATLGLSGSLTSLSDGSPYLVAGNNVVITSASNGAVTIGTTVGAYFDSTTAGSIFTTGSAAFAGANSIDSPSDVGPDVFFYVSGTVGSGSFTQQLSLFGGDVATSGSWLMNVVSGTVSGTYAVGLSDHLVVFTYNVVTATLPLAANVGTNIVFKDGTGTASTSPQMLSCSSGVIDGAATYTLPAVNYSAVTVVKVSQPDTWVVI